jgi:hypothetical protein
VIAAGSGKDAGEDFAPDRRGRQEQQRDEKTP